ncbi:unnamed protein product [Alopecurus aequalis]
MEWDWGPVMVAVVLLTPGLLCQIPGNNGRLAECRSMRTSTASMVVHTAIFFWICSFFMIAGEVHLYVGFLQPHQRHTTFCTPALRHQYPEFCSALAA